jgi:hypothetical protein
MEDRETPRMRKYGESKTTRIMMATVPHVTSGSGLRRKFQADGFLFDSVQEHSTLYVLYLTSGFLKAAHLMLTHWVLRITKHTTKNFYSPTFTWRPPFSQMKLRECNQDRSHHKLRRARL